MTPICGPEQRQQAIGQQKTRQIIQRKLLLVAIFSRHVAAARAARVIDEREQLTVAARYNVVRQHRSHVVHFALLHQVSGEIGDLSIGYGGQYRRLCSGAARFISSDADDAEALRG